ncbi:MAG: 4Fe-4S binding protein [Nitrososphaerota archaeon]|nr:4Fe-4S binding protein [Candidatus Bathyarchaeota archaeon]MDW8023007.1 4Fe-4S binding protein [Nitrososphaerota archaeon]
MEFKLTQKPKVSELPIAAIIPSPGNSKYYLTGGWRSFRPVIDKAKCVSCGLCWVYCPDNAIIKTEEGKKYDVNLDYCKGCGICAEECPVKAISMTEEEEK